MLALFLTQPATITRRTQTAASGGDYNEPIYSTTVRNVNCYVEQSTATESGAVALTTMRAYFDEGTAIDAGDLVTIDDVTYEVVGSPATYTHPVVPALNHVAVTLEHTS